MARSLVHAMSIAQAGGFSLHVLVVYNNTTLMLLAADADWPLWC
jgi:hypothetical protein